MGHNSSMRLYYFSCIRHEALLVRSFFVCLCLFVCLSVCLSVYGPSMESICKAAIKQGWAAELRQMRKRTKYEKQTMSTGEKCTKVFL